MKKWTHGTATTALLMTLTVVFIVSEVQAQVVVASRGPVYRRGPSSFEFLFEGGLAEPTGNQSDDFWTTTNGFGSSTGYQLGARLRQYLSPSVAVSPVFQYTRFGTASGVTDYGNEANLGYNVRTSNYRYGLDFQKFLGEGASPTRMFVTGGVALMNNRYLDELQYGGSYQASVNSAAFSAGIGVKMGSFEITGEYTFNRFDTNKFNYDGWQMHYNWDFLIVRAGISFGR